jgi:hypothetical protein
VKKKQEVTFLKSGQVTWTSKSGKRTKRERIIGGASRSLRVEPHSKTGGWELWDGNWSIIMPEENVRIQPDFSGRIQTMADCVRELPDTLEGALASYEEDDLPNCIIDLQDFVADCERLSTSARILLDELNKIGTSD